MVKKKCPLCGKVYKYENITVCPLLHCPSCGDAPVKDIIRTEFKHEIKEVTLGTIYLYYFMLGIGLFFFLVFLYGISPVFFGANISEMSAEHTICAILGLISFLLLMMLAKFPRIECARCRHRFNIPKRNIPLETLDLAVQVCKKCGAEMPRNAKFCGVCGYKLIERNKEGKAGRG